VVLLGHGTATGVEAADLRALATALPDHGISVALITQPYRMNRSRTGSDEASLDAAWKAVWPLAADLLPSEHSPAPANAHPLNGSATNQCVQVGKDCTQPGATPAMEFAKHPNVPNSAP